MTLRMSTRKSEDDGGWVVRVHLFYGRDSVLMYESRFKSDSEGLEKFPLPFGFEDKLLWRFSSNL